jgi:hypothetical protein
MQPSQDSEMRRKVVDDAPASPLEEAFTNWRFDAAIDHMVEQFIAKPGDRFEASETLDALLRSAFECGWTTGYNRAME